MRFTLWAVVVPLALFSITVLVIHPSPHSTSSVVLPVVFGVWFWCGLPAVLVYWVVRLVRRAWGDGSARSSARPAGWIYPDER